MESPLQSSDNGCDLSDKSSWPTNGTPTWATNARIIDDISSPQDLVTEYLHGLPGPPALKDLEEVYGPAACIKNNRVSWRQGQKGKNAKNKKWCICKPAYEIIDEEGEKSFFTSIT